jgi:hypothetical protein
MAGKLTLGQPMQLGVQGSKQRFPGLDVSLFGCDN